MVLVLVRGRGGEGGISAVTTVEKVMEGMKRVLSRLEWRIWF